MVRAVTTGADSDSLKTALKPLQAEVTTVGRDLVKVTSALTLVYPQIEPFDKVVASPK